MPITNTINSLKPAFSSSLAVVNLGFFVNAAKPTPEELDKLNQEYASGIRKQKLDEINKKQAPGREAEAAEERRKRRVQ